MKSRRDGEMEKRSRNLVFKPEKVRLGQKELLVWERDPEKGLTCRKIPYDTMVLVYPEVKGYEGQPDHLGSGTEDVPNRPV